MQHGHPGSQPDEGGELNQGNNSAELNAQIRFLEDEIASLRRKLTESPRHVRLLEQRLAEVTARFEGRDVPRPPRWSGFRLVPDVIEFWADREHRLHERRLFTRTDEGWSEGLLYP